MPQGEVEVGVNHVVPEVLRHHAPSTGLERKFSMQFCAAAALATGRVERRPESMVLRIEHDKTGKVTGVRVKNLKTEAESIIDCAGVFVAIGHIPNTLVFKNAINMDDAGYIIPTKGAATNIPGVFVAGDCAGWVYQRHEPEGPDQSYKRSASQAVTSGDAKSRPLILRAR